MVYIIREKKDIKDHVFINGSPWYTGNANLNYYLSYFFYLLLLVFFFFKFTLLDRRDFFFKKWIEGVICFTKRGALIRFDQLLQLSKYKFTNWYWLIQSERIIKVFSNDLCYYEPSCVFKLIHLENMVFMIKKKCSIWKGFKIE